MTGRKRLALAGSMLLVCALAPSANAQSKVAPPAALKGIPVFEADPKWPATPADWRNVVAVQLTLLAANTEPTPGHADSKRYNLGLGGTAGPFGDSYKRHALAAVVRVNNVSGPREQ